MLFSHWPTENLLISYWLKNQMDISGKLWLGISGKVSLTKYLQLDIPGKLRLGISGKVSLAGYPWQAMAEYLWQSVSCKVSLAGWVYLAISLAGYLGFNFTVNQVFDI